jgi:hypothetical protein
MIEQVVENQGILYRKNIMDFENRIKRVVSNNGETFSVSLDMKEAVDYPAAGIKDGHMLWTNEEILPVSTPVVDRNIELIASQMDAVELRGRSVEVSQFYQPHDYGGRG